MNWGYVKDKLLAWGHDDYVFADVFLHILEEFKKVEDIESRMIYAYIMLKELLCEKLVTVYLVSETKFDGYICLIEEDIDNLFSIIDAEWKEMKYSMPEANQLFWITSTEKGVECVMNKTFLDEE